MTPSIEVVEETTPQVQEGKSTSGNDVKTTLSDADEEEENPFRDLPWDVIEAIFHLLGHDQVAVFSKTCQVNYCLAHGYLWKAPTLTLTQAMLFLGSVYRRPVVTTSPEPHLDKLVQTERQDSVSRVDLQFYRESMIMDELMIDAVINLVKWCPEARIRTGVLADRKAEWHKYLAKKLERVTIVGYEEITSGQFVTEEEAAEARKKEEVAKPKQVPAQHNTLSAQSQQLWNILTQNSQGDVSLGDVRQQIQNLMLLYNLGTPLPTITGAEGSSE